MAKKKLKKALMLGAALAGGLGLAKRARSKAVEGMDDAGRGVNWYNHRMDKLPFADHTTVKPDFLAGYKKGGRVTGIAKRGFGRALMKGKKY